MTTRAILASADMTAACKTIDTLRLAAQYEAVDGQPCEATVHLADDLSTWVKNHRPMTSNQKSLLDEAT
jgi:hypothetical protein